MSRPLRTAHETALAFVDAINGHDVDRLLDLSSKEPRFVDSRGDEVCGRDALRRAWLSYFELFSDYRIEVEAVAAVDVVVLIAGWAVGTFRAGQDGASAWRIPAAWRALVHDQAVDTWQVYADNTPVIAILARAASREGTT